MVSTSLVGFIWREPGQEDITIKKLIDHGEGSIIGRCHHRIDYGAIILPPNHL